MCDLAHVVHEFFQRGVHVRASEYSLRERWVWPRLSPSRLRIFQAETHCLESLLVNCLQSYR
eukprot:365844-Chlamydomonas_euryale.AAC.2